MRFLITGGAGFLGSALANRLAQDGHTVRVLDDLSNGQQEYLDKNVAFTQGDVNNVPLLWSLLQDVDCVYHLAARVSVAQSILYPRDYNAVNVGGTVSLMEAVRSTGVRRVILASSGALYGEQDEQPVHETDLPRPDSPYGVSKWAAEQYVQTIGALGDIETVILRIFNAYGPRQSLPASHAPVVPRFLYQVLTSGSVVVFGDGLQTRDFVYVTDVVNGMVNAAANKAAVGQTFNLGSGQEISLNHLIEAISTVAGKRVTPLYNRNKAGGVRRLVADISKARLVLGFQPHTSLTEGLRRLVAQDERFQV
ncbi:MAG: NAD-dependent epimerase/dehydratase family protein [Chloroflexi bacterium]|nr:NAD-dependent epimerase/dehydratase family protein [Chloroflexota bacterium]